MGSRVGALDGGGGGSGRCTGGAGGGGRAMMMLNFRERFPAVVAVFSVESYDVCRGGERGSMGRELGRVESVKNSLFAVCAVGVLIAPLIGVMMFLRQKG